MTRYVQVVPAILTDDPKALEVMVRQSEKFTDYVQIDIMDGKFVPSRSITCKHLLNLSIGFKWEAHLMVEKPENCLKDYRKAGAQRIVFHFEATSSPIEVISRVKDLGMSAGLAINPETPVSAILPLVQEVDSILFLTVHPGFYGSQFIPEVMNKVAELRNTVPDIDIGVDGGVKESNIAYIAGFEVNYIFVGSAIFMQPQPDQSFQHLVSLAQEGLLQQD